MLSAVTKGRFGSRLWLLFEPRRIRRPGPKQRIKLSFLSRGVVSVRKPTVLVVPLLHPPHCFLLANVGKHCQKGLTLWKERWNFTLDSFVPEQIKSRRYRLVLVFIQ